MSDWIDRAACRNVSPELFFGPDHEGEAAREMRERSALMVCARCPVTHLCRERAIASHDRWSISGGTTPEQRTSVVKRASRASWGEANRAAIAAAGEKPCSRCRAVKPLSKFARDGGTWRSDCRDCRNARDRRRRQEVAS